jgi:hypothetical protein
MLPSFLGICATPTGGGGCPAYGTIISWNYGVTYPIAEGGESVELFPDGISGYYPTQDCDVPVKADGSCGTFVDWASATNIVYKSVGTILAEDSVGYYRGPMSSSNYYVNCGQVGSFSPGTYHNKFVSDGSGSSTSEDVNDYYPYESDEGLNNPYDVWTSCEDDTPMSVNLFWDGEGNLVY